MLEGAEFRVFVHGFVALGLYRSILGLPRFRLQASSPETHEPSIPKCNELLV